MISNKSILITGASGFIGSHLCDFFIKNDNRVIGVDNLSTGKLENLSMLENEKKFEFIEHDIIKPLKYNFKFDYILNFACPASPIDYLKLPLETLKVGSIGTLNCLELAKKNNSIFLTASTSEIYGDPLIHPQNEKYFGNVNPIGPRSVYDESKRFSESATFAYKRLYNLDTRIIRIFNTYGPKMRLNDGRVIPSFIGSILSNKDLVVYGDGSQTRSFCYIDDLISGINKVLLSDYSFPINLGNPNEVSILMFAEEIIKLTRSNCKIIYTDLPQDDPKIRKPDISIAYEILNWKPKISRNEGLLKTIEYFKCKM